MRKLLFCLLFGISTIVSAEDVFDLAAEYTSQKQNLTVLEKEKRKVLSELYEIEKDTKGLVDEKSELDLKKVKLDRRLKSTSQRIVGIEHSLQKMTPELTERFSFADRINSLPWVYALLTSQSVSDLDQLFEAAGRINNLQADQIDRFISLLDELAERKKYLKETAQNIVQTRKSISLKEKLITGNQKAKKHMLKKLRKKIRVTAQSIKKTQLRGRKALLESEFKDLGLLFGGQFFDLKGQLPHPTKGQVSHAFGLNQRLKEDDIDLVNKGYFYKGKANDSVQAIADGRVRAIKKVAGLGYVIVLDHGSRYYSTYGNLQNIRVKKGQEVKQGAPLGLIGHKHLQFAYGLYFEIRHFSQPQDPKKWLKPRRQGLATL